MTSDLNTYLSNTIETLQPQELCELIPLYEYSDSYIRVQPSRNLIDRKKEELIVSAPGVKPIVVEITQNLVVKQVSDEEYVLIEGNCRQLAYNELLSEHGDKDDWVFHPIKIQYFEPEITEENLYRFQILSNDTTASHSPLELAEAAYSYKLKLQEQLESELGKQKAAKVSTEKVMAAFNIKSQSLLTRYRYIATASDFLKEMYANGYIQAQAIQKIGTLLGKPENSDLTEEAIFYGIRQAFFDPTELEFSISEKHVEDWFNSRSGMTDTDTTDTGSDASENDYEDTEIDVDRGEMIKLGERISDEFCSIDPEGIEDHLRARYQRVVDTMIVLIAGVLPRVNLVKHEKAITCLQDLLEIIDLPEEYEQLPSDELNSQVSKIKRVKKALESLRNDEEATPISTEIDTNTDEVYSETDGEVSVVVS